ncbi:MAG: hypothetical protein J6B89_02835 [Bacilli bacterium]|nr:hypothetical protein [Bacilli bacterium]
MALTGFDPSLVNGSINKVKNAYENLIQVLGDDMQNQFVEGMADKWACADAQNFFTNNFKPAIDNLIRSSTTIFESVVSSMNSAGQAWATEQYETYSPVSFSAINKTIDTSSIRDSVGGLKGADLELTPAVVAKLSILEEDAYNALLSAQQAVQNSGFVGGDQQTNLINSLGTIKNNISIAMKDINADTKSAIDSTLQRYGNTGKRISQAFAAEG